MPRLLTAVIEAFQQPDIRKRLLFTFGILTVFRFVAHVPIPGVDPDQLKDVFEGNAVLGFLNLFSGGALRRLSVAAMGVYPYITATIIMQLLIPIVPALQALSKEGEQGRNKITLYTHWMTVPLAVLQGYSQLLVLERFGAISGIGFSGDEALPTFAAVASMAAGTMFLVWLGELITENGIGNGISLIIFGGIVAGMPSLLPSIANSDAGLAGIGLLAVLGVALVGLIVYFYEAQRRVPVQFARSMFRGGRMYRQSGQTHIPLRVNSAGMIPLIFAFSLVVFPATVAQSFESSNTEWVRNVAQFISGTFSPGNAPYYVMVFVLVVAFAFFYTLVIFQQQNLAENLQRQGGFVPGIRPGRPTQDYIMRVLVRITWAGALFLGFVAVVPYIATSFTDVQALTISSTGLLIVVGVVLDTMKQLEAQLLMRNYAGFIR
ncbi:MAG: preprotein translocase subunit SecY [Dehalococcoidia bacterium]|nr:preprotein translocase subunit SecY [Dehalococcoidia bacterium]